MRPITSSSCSVVFSRTSTLPVPQWPTVVTSRARSCGSSSSSLPMSRYSLSSRAGGCVSADQRRRRGQPSLRVLVRAGGGLEELGVGVGGGVVRGGVGVPPGFLAQLGPEDPPPLRRKVRVLWQHVLDGVAEDVD